jgi:hypothetical protein
MLCGTFIVTNFPFCGLTPMPPTRYCRREGYPSDLRVIVNTFATYLGAPKNLKFFGRFLWLFFNLQLNPKLQSNLKVAKFRAVTAVTLNIYLLEYDIVSLDE